MTGTSAPNPPQHVPPELVRDFNYFAPAGGDRDPHSVIRGLREQPPIFYSTAMGGFWVVTTASLIEEIIDRPTIFSNSPVVLWSINTDNYPIVPEELDPPGHIKYRRHLSPIFARKKMEGMRDFIASITNELIDNVLERGGCEFVEDIAGPLPFRLFLHMMDVPESDLPMMRGWMDDMMRSADPVKIKSAKDAAEAYFRDLASVRRSRPGDDMLSHLLRAEVDGRPIDEAPLISMAMVLMQGSLDTTTNELTFQARFLAENPSHRVQLVSDPGLILNAVEEMMRHFGIVNSIRTIKQDVEIGGVLLKERDQILVPHMLWGLDPERVDRCDEMDFHRPEPAHRLFGAGTHVCAGAPLVRVEIPVFWREWLRRIPDFDVVPGAEIHTHVGMIMGTKALPLQWPKNAAGE